MFFAGFGRAGCFGGFCCDVFCYLVLLSIFGGKRKFAYNKQVRSPDMERFVLQIGFHKKERRWGFNNFYRIDDLNNPIAEKVCLADVGFIWKNQIVYATRGGELSISGVRGTKNFHFNDVEWLYRVSYNPDNPHELLISGQKKGGYIFSWIFNPSKKYLYDLSDNGDVAYKAALFNGKCYYAKRGNGGFEDRHIVMAQNLRISELSYDDIVGNSQEANSPSILKMLQNFTNATFRWASAGFKIADDETLAKRQAICDTCQYWKASALLGMGKCLKCGCTSLKLKFDTEKCPTGKW